MDDIEKSEARGHFPDNQGVTKAVNRMKIDEAIATIRTLQKKTDKVTVEELLSFRHEGHKY